MNKGLAKLGNIVEDVMFASLTAQENILFQTKILLPGRKKKIFESGQKHSWFSDANFASETNVSQLNHIRKKQCFRNNVP